jgi:hypothetical protein
MEDNIKMVIKEIVLEDEALVRNQWRRACEHGNEHSDSIKGG